MPQWVLQAKAGKPHDTRTSEMNMTIRPAEFADLEPLATLYSAFFQEDGITTAPEAIRVNLGMMLRDARARVFVAEVDGAIAGFSSGSLTFGVEFGCAAELEDLYLRPEYRGQGWARDLAAAVLHWAEARGACEIILVITPEAEAEQDLTAFYRKLGFENSRRLTMYRTRQEATG